MKKLVNEVKEHVTGVLLPFWQKLKDEEYGGFYGYMDYFWFLLGRKEWGMSPMWYLPTVRLHVKMGILCIL